MYTFQSSLVDGFIGVIIELGIKCAPLFILIYIPILCILCYN